MSYLARLRSHCSGFARVTDRLDWIGRWATKAIPRVVGDDEFFTEHTAYLRCVERSPHLIRDGDGLE